MIGLMPWLRANAGLPDRSVGARGFVPVMPCRSPPGGGWFVSAVTITRGEVRVLPFVHADAAPVGLAGRNETQLIITASTLWRGK